MNDATSKRLANIEKLRIESYSQLEALRNARNIARQPIRPIAPRRNSRGPAPRKHRLVAQGDSWFDYLPGHDLIDYLEGFFGHQIENIGIAGATMNDIAYGRVPKNIFGIPRTDSLTRMTQLIDAIERIRPAGVMLSGGGNDIAGTEFFMLLNNAFSGLDSPSTQVLQGITCETLKKSYMDVIDIILAKSEDMGLQIPIFLHGYDYPWPDGRGLIAFNLIGPWFHDAFNSKNYPYEQDDQSQLMHRFEILQIVMDAFNDMLHELASFIYPGQVFYIDLRGTLKSKHLWANELHPTDEGFALLAKKYNKTLVNLLG